MAIDNSSRRSGEWLRALDSVPHRGYIMHMSTDSIKKTAYIRARVRPRLKRDAEQVLDRLGISTTDAISIFLKQVSLQNGLPFNIKIPNEETQAALREDLSNAKEYTDVDELFDDILGKDWRKRNQ